MPTPLDILIIEDNPGDAELIQDMVSDNKTHVFRFAHVERLASALRHMKANATDLVMADLGLPDSSGVETVTRIRRAVPHVPIVVLTGHDDEETGMAAVKAGAQDYLVKGKVSGDLLARVIVYAVERHQTQDSLRESEQFLRSAMDALAAHIAIIDQQGKILSVNQAWLAFARDNGADREDGFVGLNYLDACVADAGNDDRLATAFADGIRAVIHGEKDLFELEYPCHSLDQKRWFHGRVTPFPDKGPRRVVIAHENITDRKLAENRDKESERRLRLVLDTSPNCIFIEDLQGHFVLVNQAVADLYGKTKRAMIGKTQQEVAPFGFRGNGGTSRRSSSDTPWTEQDVPFMAPDGSTRWFRIIQTPISFPDAPDCKLSIGIDMTDQRDAQEALRNSELRLKTILDAQTSNVVLLDTQMHILWPNQEACRVAGLSRQEIINRPCYEIWHEKDGACEDCPVANALQHGRMYSVNKKSPDGHVWRIHGCPVLDDTGAIVNAVEVAEDITERIALEEQLRQAQKMESLGTLAGGIAHDFNNILSAIIGYTELAMEITRDSATTQEYLEEVHQAGHRATDLVRQILTFSRRTEMDLAPLDIRIIIKEALKLLRSTLPTSITIQQHIDKNLDQVLADPTQIHQIIMNLCTNAGHAMEPHGGTLEVRLTQCDFTAISALPAADLAPGTYLRLDVSDTGCGMPPEIMASIFDPYFTTKDLGVGTGLGLSVVHGIVKDYGGDISVRSTVGKGSTFTILFPSVKMQSDEHRQNVKEILPKGSEHILLVDDEPPILKLVGELLTNFGYRVTSENDSRLAFERFKERPDAFDLVLSDVTMPKMTGDRLARKILAIRHDIPIILCTGYSRLVTEQTFESIGVRALLPKPVVRSKLLTEVRRLLDEPIENRLSA